MFVVESRGWYLKANGGWTSSNDGCKFYPTKEEAEAALTAAKAIKATGPNGFGAMSRDAKKAARVLGH